jgi:hypothetical protein
MTWRQDITSCSPLFPNQMVCFAARGGEAVGLQQPHPLPSKSKFKFKKFRICKNNGTKRFTWFTLQPKSSTVAGWEL